MRQVSASIHAHVCSMPLVMFQGSVVWAMQRCGYTVVTITREYEQAENPDHNSLKHGQWHAADVGMT